MKIANKKPDAIQVPVYVTESQYEIWYASPKSLGKIDKINGYWYTVDGMKFISSREAMKYLITCYDAGVSLTPAPEKIPAVRKPTPPPTAAPSLSISRSLAAEPEFNQNHPQFQMFLDFLEFSNKTKRMPPVTELKNGTRHR